MSSAENIQAPAGFPRPEHEGTPAWEVAFLFPYQGDWSEYDYLSLITNRFVELADGHLHVLPSPTTSHQDVLCQLAITFWNYLDANKAGRMVIGAYPVRIRPRTFRVPDIVFVLKSNLHRLGEQFSEAADW